MEVVRFYGDKTGWLYVQHEQTLKAEVIEGVKSSLVTNINFDVSPNAVLHVPLNMTVAGTKAVLSGKVTFENLKVEDGGEVVLNPTSFTVSFTNGQYISTSQPGKYSLSLLSLKRGSVFSPATGLDLEVVTMDMKRYVKLYADYVTLTVGQLILEREAELNVAGRGNNSVTPVLSRGKDKSGGGYASSGGVAQGKTVNDAPKAYGTLYTPTLPGTQGGDGGMGGSYITISVVDFTLYGILNANGADSTTGKHTIN